LFIVESINNVLSPLVQQYGDMAVASVIGLVSTIITFVLAAYFGPKVNEIELRSKAKTPKENGRSKQNKR